MKDGQKLLEPLANLLKEKHSRQWLKQATAHKIVSKLAPASIQLLSNFNAYDWSLWTLATNEFVSIKEYLNSASQLDTLFTNVLHYQTLSPSVKMQIKASFAKNNFRHILFKKELKANENFSAASQQLSVADLTLRSLYLAVPFNLDVINAMSEYLNLCTRNFPERIGTTQQKLIITNFRENFLGVVTIYPALNIYFISGDKNGRLPLTLETEIIEELTNNQVLNRDSLQLTTEEDFRIANHNVKTSFYKDKINQAPFYQRAYTHFSTIEATEVVEPTPDYSCEVVYLNPALELKRSNLLRRLEQETDCKSLLRAIKAKLKCTEDPTEIDFFDSLLTEDDEPYSDDFFETHFYPYGDPHE